MFRYHVVTSTDRAIGNFNLRERRSQSRMGMCSGGLKRARRLLMRHKVIVGMILKFALLIISHWRETQKRCCNNQEHCRQHVQTPSELLSKVLFLVPMLGFRWGVLR